MKKIEYIERYGTEWYEAYKERNRIRCKAKRMTTDHEKVKAKRRERYANDHKYRETYKFKCRMYGKKRHKELYNVDKEYTLNERIRKMRRYCKVNEFEIIENYELAKADNFKGWVIHHRLELTLEGEYANSVDDLKRMKMYYNRSYFELIFLTRSEHMKLHKGNNYNEERE